MKLSNALAPLRDLPFVLKIAFIPTFRAILRKPTLLLHPSLISREFMTHVWVVFGNGIDEGSRGFRTTFITPNAYGVVLDIGAGYGHIVQYLNPTGVIKYVALEPNTVMHTEIRAKANEAGFTEEAGTLLILPYGAEQTSLINSALGGAHSVDTIISILTLCSVPNPQETIRGLVGSVLKPGGTLLFNEHVLNRRSNVAWWQRFWTPIWGWAFDGCCLDRPTDIWVEELDVWESKDLWVNEGEPEENLCFHRCGKLVKVA